jgi:hypothetical protein
MMASWYRLVWVALVFAATLTVACNKESSKGTSQPNPDGAAGPGAGPWRKPGPIQAIMAKLTRGPQSLSAVIGEELNEEPPPWDKLQAQTKEFVELAGSMSKHEPPKGSKESWTKLTSAYTETAVTLDKAVQGKNKDAALNAHQTLSSACMACHKEHRGMPGFPGRPGVGGAKGPFGGPPPGESSAPPPGESPATKDR